MHLINNHIRHTIISKQPPKHGHLHHQHITWCIPKISPLKVKVDMGSKENQIANKLANKGT